MERKSSPSSGSSGWNTSLSVSKRERVSISQCIAQKNRRILELEKQLGASRLQEKEKDQRILEIEDLVESLRKRLDEEEGEVFKRKKENVVLRSKEGKWAEEVEKLKEDAANHKAAMEAALKAKERAEEEMTKMGEELAELRRSSLESYVEAPAQASSDDDEEDVNQTGRERDIPVDHSLKLQRNRWKNQDLPVVSLSSAEEEEASASSSVRQVVTKEHGRLSLWIQVQNCGRIRTPHSSPRESYV